MGYVLCTSACYVCDQLFPYHPHKVPSIRDANNQRQPICRACMLAANHKRKKLNLAPLPINPEAYEPCDENEL